MSISSDFLYLKVGAAFTTDCCDDIVVKAAIAAPAVGL